MINVQTTLINKDLLTQNDRMPSITCFPPLHVRKTIWFYLANQIFGAL